jgi:hypothetical protein
MATAPHWVPVGDFCLPAEVAKRAGVRGCALPFDWLFTNVDFVAACLHLDFEPLMDLVYVHRGVQTQYVFPAHPIPKSSCPHHDCAVPATRQRFMRSMRRLTDALLDARPCVLLHASYAPPDMPVLVRSLQALRAAASGVAGCRQGAPSGGPVACVTVQYVQDEAPGAGLTLSAAADGVHVLRVGVAAGHAPPTPDDWIINPSSRLDDVAAFVAGLLVGADGALHAPPTPPAASGS